MPENGPVLTVTFAPDFDEHINDFLLGTFTGSRQRSDFTRESITGYAQDGWALWLAYLDLDQLAPTASFEIQIAYSDPGGSLVAFLEIPLIIRPDILGPVSLLHHELLTGEDINGSTVDAVVIVGAQLGLTPGGISQVMAHEFGHALGFLAARNFERLVEGSVFIGQNAVTANGGPVQVNADHIVLPAASIMISDALFASTTPTSLDAAILADLGLPVIVGGVRLEGPSNNAPVLTAASTVSVAENTTSVLTASATDAEGDPITFSLTGADAGFFDIGTGGVVTFKTAPDFETKADEGANNVYDFNIVVTDFFGLTDFQAVAVTVTNINDAPVLTAASTASVAENTTSVLTASATDAESDSITFALTGADAGFFDIGTGGVVTFKTAPDFETKADDGEDNVYNFNIVVANVLGQTDTQAVAVTVTNINEAPVLTAASTASVAENTTSVLTASTTDSDAGDSITYSLSGPDSAFFNISAGGVITFKTAPDFETKADDDEDNVYIFNIVVTDVLGLTDFQAVAVTVTNINEAPVLAEASTASVAENTTSVLIASATDPEGDSITYSLTGADAAFFNIGTGGVVTFKTAPDFETKNDTGSDNVYDFNIVVTDAPGLTDTQAVAVTVVNVDEGTGSPTSGITFVATEFNDFITGSDGLDTVIFNVNRANSTLKIGDNGTVIVEGTGRDTLTGIERLQFLDGTLALDTSGNAGQTYRLYQAAFDRTPDTPGLAVNVNLLDTVLSLRDLSNAFIASVEFINLFGVDSSNETFITSLYQNVLDRLPDEAGFNGWNDLLVSGQLDRADVLIGFSESPENIALVGVAIENGIFLG